MAFNEGFDSTELCHLLQVVEVVRSLQEPSDLMKFPDIVVCGVQSSGKSSVLQALAGVNLPRSKKITTRVPLQLNLVVDANLERGRSYALIGTDPDLERSGKRFEEEDLDDLGEEIEKITTKLAGPPPGVESSAVIYLRMVRTQGPTMTLVDLPGISYKDDIIMEVTRECFRSRFTDPDNNNIILLVKTAAMDVEAEPAMEEARRVDPKGERTICVLTNMDRAFDPENMGRTIETLGDVAKVGVFPVYNPERSDITPQKARQLEERFFRERAHNFGLSEGKWGIGSLGQSLMEAQSPVVKSTLRTIRQSVEERLAKTTDDLGKLKEPDRDRVANLRLIETTLYDVQNAFEDRALNHPVRNRRSINFDRLERVYEELNVAKRTDDLYKEFMGNIFKITPNWLSDDSSKSKVIKAAQQHQEGDVLPQTANAEITLFREAYQRKLATECKGLVIKVRACVKEILVLLFGLEEVTETRPGLLPYMSNLLDKFLDKRLIKAEEVVDYLSRAELTKRYTQDKTYVQIKKKVEHLAEEAHRRLATPGAETSPPEQVVRKVNDDNVDDIPEGFIVSYYRRALEQNKVDAKEEIIAKLQLSLFAYSKIATRRINDVVPMQAHLLLVTSVFDREVSGAFNDCALVTDLKSTFEQVSDEDLKKILAFDPMVEQKAQRLQADIDRLGKIAHAIDSIPSSWSMHV